MHGFQSSLWSAEKGNSISHVPVFAPGNMVSRDKFEDTGCLLKDNSIKKKFENVKK